MKTTKLPSLVSIAILTTITILFWTVFNVYRVLTNKAPITIQENLMEPLSPNLDTQTLDKIQNSLVFEENQFQTPQPTPEGP